MPEELRQIEYASPPQARRGDTVRATLAVFRLGFSVTLFLLTAGLLVGFLMAADSWGVALVVLVVLGLPVLVAAGLVFVDVRRTLFKRRG